MNSNINIIKKFKNRLLVVNPRTKEEAKKFVKICHDLGIKWENTQSQYITYYRDYEMFTCYAVYFNNNSFILRHNNINYFKKWHKEVDIFTYEEFMNEYNKERE